MLCEVQQYANKKGNDLRKGSYLHNLSKLESIVIEEIKGEFQKSRHVRRSPFRFHS
jgi:hypothetical protein